MPIVDLDAIFLAQASHAQSDIENPAADVAGWDAGHCVMSVFVQYTAVVLARAFSYVFVCLQTILCAYPHIESNNRTWATRKLCNACRSRPMKVPTNEKCADEAIQRVKE